MNEIHKWNNFFLFVISNVISKIYDSISNIFISGKYLGKFNAHNPGFPKFPA